MTALNWKIVPGHEAQWRSEVFRTNAEGEIRIFQGDQVWHVNATVNGHHYAAEFTPDYAAREVRTKAGNWLDRIIQVQQEDLDRASEAEANHRAEAG